MSRCDSELLFHDAMGELHGPARRALQEHLLSCAPCRSDREEWNRFVNRARLDTLATGQSAALPPTARMASTRTHRKTGKLESAAAIAAGFFLILGFHALVAPSSGDTREKTALLTRLESYQEEDGSWAGQIGATSLAAIAMLDSGALESRAESRERIEQAVHFLTRTRHADSEEELLRALALLKEHSRTGSPPSPQLQRAIDHAVLRSRGDLDTRKTALLRDLVTQSRRAGLETAAGEQALGSAFVRQPGTAPSKTDWAAISRSVARKDKSQTALPSIEIAQSLIARSSALLR